MGWLLNNYFTITYFTLWMIICNSTARIPKVSLSFTVTCASSVYTDAMRSSIFFYKGNSTMTNFYGLLYFFNSPFFQMTGYKTMTDVTMFMILYPYVHLYFLCGLIYNMGVFPCLSHEVLTALNVGNNNTH